MRTLNPQAFAVLLPCGVPPVAGNETCDELEVSPPLPLFFFPIFFKFTFFFAGGSGTAPANPIEEASSPYAFSQSFVAGTCFSVVTVADELEDVVDVDAGVGVCNENQLCETQ